MPPARAWGFGGSLPHTASHSESAALSPLAEAASLSHSNSDGPSLTRSLAWGCAWRPEAASLSHSNSDGPSLTRSLAWGCAWRPEAASLASSAPAGPARLLAGGPAGAGEAALSAKKMRQRQAAKHWQQALLHKLEPVTVGHH
jgi:hypothetical protein